MELKGGLYQDNMIMMGQNFDDEMDEISTFSGRSLKASKKYTKKGAMMSSYSNKSRGLKMK